MCVGAVCPPCIHSQLFFLQMWFGSCIPLRVSTASVPAGDRVTILGGPYPRLHLVSPVAFDTNRVRWPSLTFYPTCFTMALQATIRSEQVPDLEIVAGLISSNPGIRVCINGHVNFCKRPEAALKLSQDRANAVMQVT